MAISSFEAQKVEDVPSSRKENGYLLAPGPYIKKTKDTLFPQTLKVDEKR